MALAIFREKLITPNLDIRCNDLQNLLWDLLTR
jgi:hypothetical protein